ncbi:MAG: methyltransferase domain-containing protein [Solirubrobacteraceae bacterium]
MNTTESLPLPPLDLLQRAGHVGDHDPEGAYLGLGFALRAQIEAILPPGWSWKGKRVLDFGSGAGKVLRHFEAEANEAEFWGCDIDEPSIEWMQSNICPPFHAFACHEEAGLPQPDGYFDLIFAFSVYTHITDHWAEWLLEHHRVLAPDGLLLATFLGEGMSQVLTDEPWCEDRIGMNVLRAGNPWDVGGPTAFLSPWWLRAHWGRAFEILDLWPYMAPEPRQPTAADPAMGQGMILLRRKPVQLTVEDLVRLERNEPREIGALQHNIRQLRNETIELRRQQAELELRRQQTELELGRQRAELLELHREHTELASQLRRRSRLRSRLRLG